MAVPSPFTCTSRRPALGHGAVPFCIARAPRLWREWVVQGWSSANEQQVHSMWCQLASCPAVLTPLNHWCTRADCGKDWKQQDMRLGFHPSLPPARTAPAEASGVAGATSPRQSYPSAAVLRQAPAALEGRCRALPCCQRTRSVGGPGLERVPRCSD